MAEAVKFANRITTWREDAMDDGMDDDSSDNSDFEHEDKFEVQNLAPPHTHAHGVIRINPQVLRQRAYNTAYGFKVPRKCMVVVDVLLNMELLGEEANAASLKKRVRKVLERSTDGPALEAIKIALHKRMIAFKRKGSKKIFGFAPPDPEREIPDQKAMSEAVSQYMSKSPDVILAQLADLKDLTAGSDLLPGEAYFNILQTYDEYKKKGK
jgi:hypothetical protein